MLKPYYSDDSVEIYLGDCREILPQLPKADLVVTDPPYEQGHSGGGMMKHKRQGVFGVISEDLSDFETEEFIPWILGASEPVHGYIFCSAKQVRKYLNAISEKGLNHDLLVYGKRNPMPLKNNRYITDCEFIVFYRSPNECFLNSDLPMEKYKKIKMRNCKPSQFGHPTEKEVSIVAELIEISTKPGQLGIDPFCGSGTTLKAARSLGRRAIGIEKEEKYIKGAIKRLAQGELLL